MLAEQAALHSDGSKDQPVPPVYESMKVGEQVQKYATVCLIVLFSEFYSILAN
jgi:hypothetical protein